MSCTSIVTLNLAIQATPDEIEEAAFGMKLPVRSKTATAIDCGTVLFTRPNDKASWTVTASAIFNSDLFRRELARAKVLSEARRQGYRVTRDERQGERIVIRLKVQ